MSRRSFSLHRARRLVAAVLALAGVTGFVILNPNSYDNIPDTSAESNSTDQINESSNDSPLAIEILKRLEVKGRAPKTGYDRKQFYDGWPSIEGCNLRQRILRREFGDTAKLADDNCSVLAGEFDEPYTGKHLQFSEKTAISKGVQIDHVVALSDAWQKGAQNLSKDERYNLATDPLNLLAVDASTNQDKSDGDAATWLPPNKFFRCQYIARQISVKYKYHLWVTEAEKTAMNTVLENCPNEKAVGIE